MQQQLAEGQHAAFGASVRAKTVLQAMTDGIRVDARDKIGPTFLIPAVPGGRMSLKDGE